MRPARQSALACSMRSLRRRDEVPFDEALADRLAAQQHHVAAPTAVTSTGPARLKHEHLPGAEASGCSISTVPLAT